MDAKTSQCFSTLFSSLKQTIVQHKIDINQPEFQLKRRMLLNIEKALSKQVDCFCLMLNPQLPQIGLNREVQERMVQTEELREKELQQRQQKQTELAQRQLVSAKQSTGVTVTDDSEGIIDIEQVNQVTKKIPPTGRKVKAAKKSAPSKRRTYYSTSFDEKEDNIYLEDAVSQGMNSIEKLEELEVDADQDNDADDTEQIKRLVEKYQKEGIQEYLQDQDEEEDGDEEKEDKTLKYAKSHHSVLCQEDKQQLQGQFQQNNVNQNEHIEANLIDVSDSSVKEITQPKLTNTKDKESDNGQLGEIVYEEEHQSQDDDQFEQKSQAAEQEYQVIEENSEQSNVSEQQDQVQHQAQPVESKGKCSKQQTQPSKPEVKEWHREGQDNCSTQPVSANKSQSESLNEGIYHLEGNQFVNNVNSEHSLDKQRNQEFLVESNQDSQETNNHKQEFSQECFILVDQ